MTAALDLWAKRIRSVMADTVESMFALGRLLEDCASECGGDPIRGTYRDVLAEVGISWPTVRMLRSIARSPLSDVASGNALPPSWRTNTGGDGLVKRSVPSREGAA